MEMAMMEETVLYDHEETIEDEDRSTKGDDQDMNQLKEKENVEDNSEELDSTMETTNNDDTEILKIFESPKLRRSGRTVKIPERYRD
jgi:hypothetical protein